MSAAKHRKYPRADLIVDGAWGYIAGFVVGSIQGVIGSFAVPTSVRMMNDSLDDTLDDVLNGRRGSIAERYCNLAYHATRLPVRISAHATALYAAAANIAEVVQQRDIGELDKGWLLLPNLMSLGYEFYRLRRRE